MEKKDQNQKNRGSKILGVLLLSLALLGSVGYILYSMEMEKRGLLAAKDQTIEQLQKQIKEQDKSEEMKSLMGKLDESKKMLEEAQKSQTEAQLKIEELTKSLDLANDEQIAGLNKKLDELNEKCIVKPVVKKMAAKKVVAKKVEPKKEEPKVEEKSQIYIINHIHNKIQMPKSAPTAPAAGELKPVPAPMKPKMPIDLLK